MIFVVGTGRCGTSMVRDALNLHPDVYMPREETFWWPLLFADYGRTANPYGRYLHIVRGCRFQDGRPVLDVILEPAGLSFPELLHQLDEELGARPVTVTEFGDTFYGILGRHQGASVFGDKTPEYGAYMSQLLVLWPRARFVHVVRDGRDAARSMSRRPGFRLMARDGVGHWPIVAFSGSRTYPLPVERGRTLKRLRGIPLERDFRFRSFLELWAIRLRRIRDEAGALPEGCYMEIRYEDILDNPEAELSRIAAHAGITAVDGWLSAAREGVRPARRSQEALPEDAPPEVAELMETYGYL